MDDEFRRPNNNSTEITPHESEQRLSPIMKDSSSSAFSKPILPSTSSLHPPKLHFAPPLLNGSIKFGSPSNNPIPAPTSPNTSYRECHRNHAAGVGGHVTDGCGEFMPAGFANPLKCMACGCHRSFHRKESEPDLIINDYKYQSSSEEKVERGRKRFRTKFSEEQKEKMKGFGERVGWRVQKKDDGEMDRFCKGLGINRQVLRVWMHNNRHFFNNDDGKQERRGIKVDNVLLRPQP